MDSQDSHSKPTFFHKKICSRKGYLFGSSVNCCKVSSLPMLLNLCMNPVDVKTIKGPVSGFVGDIPLPTVSASSASV